MKNIIRNSMILAFVVVLAGNARAIPFDSTMTRTLASSSSIASPVVSTDEGSVYNWQSVSIKVGPTVKKSVPEAYLKVYTEAHPYFDGDVQRVNRLPYTIYSADGKKVKWVAWNDFDPKLIALPPGKYVIVPETRRTHTEIIGADLVAGQLTEIHLKGENPI